MAGFIKAQRQRVSIKIAVTGPSGSGKTYSALRLAFGLAGKAGRVAFIDTENGSGSLYAQLGDYDVMEIGAPFTAQKYIAAIQEAAGAGYDVVIIDSLSHAWAGEGGILDQKTARDARGGNSFSNWAEAGKPHEQLKAAILQSQVHVIATMRSKQDYVIEQGQGGKQAPRKVGLAPIQREGMEYEFTTVFDVDMGHTAATSKDRTGLFTDEIAQITEGHGQRLRGWLSGAAAQTPPAEVAAVQATEPTPMMTEQPPMTSEEALKAERFERAKPLVDLVKDLPADKLADLRKHWETKFGTANPRMLGFEVMESEYKRLMAELFPAAAETADTATEADPFADTSAQPALMAAPTETAPGHAKS